MTLNCNNRIGEISNFHKVLKNQRDYPDILSSMECRRILFPG